jgi:hypothetical protein
MTDNLAAVLVTLNALSDVELASPSVFVHLDQLACSRYRNALLTHCLPRAGRSTRDRRRQHRAGQNRVQVRLRIHWCAIISHSPEGIRGTKGPLPISQKWRLLPAASTLDTLSCVSPLPPKGTKELAHSRPERLVQMLSMEAECSRGQSGRSTGLYRGPDFVHVSTPRQSVMNDHPFGMNCKVTNVRFRILQGVRDRLKLLLLEASWAPSVFNESVQRRHVVTKPR